MNTHKGYTLPFALQPLQKLTLYLGIDADADFTLDKVYSDEDGAFKVMILDTTSTYQWFSDPIRRDNFFGSAQYPNELPQSIDLKRNTQLKIEIENLTNAANDGEMVFEGYRITDSGFQPRKNKYYCYVKDFTVPASNNAKDSLRIDGDSDFLVNRFICWQDLDYVLKAKIAPSSLASMGLYTQYTLLENIFGSVLRPNNLRHPLLLGKNSTVAFDLSNVDAGDPTTVPPTLPADHNCQLVFDGVKIWS